MDISSLVRFFYNILPGVYIWILLPSTVKCQFSSYLRLDKNSIFDLFLLLGLALIIGFVFQGLTKLIRLGFLDGWVIRDTIAENSVSSFKNAKEILRKTYTVDVDKESEKQVFYLMDNYINSSEKNKLPTHFSDRTSLWANLFWANLCIIYFACWYLSNIYFFAFSIFVVPVVAYQNFKGQQDTVLKSFLMQHPIEDSKQKKQGAKKKSKKK